MKELLKRLRRYEIKIRKAITSQMKGDFHSLFKGSGLEFDDVRPYQYGDDIRTIDWNVSAKGHGAFVKTFKEDKEQTVYFLLDVSASEDIGASGRTKGDVGKEICGVLALSAIRESGHVGLICYSDQKEVYLKAKKGIAQAYAMISSLASLRPKSLKTSLSGALSFCLNTIKRKSVIIMVSDFIDENHFDNLKAMAKKHDLVMIHLHDKRETELHQLGIIPVVDKETQKTYWLNSSFGNFGKTAKSRLEERILELEIFCKKHQASFLSLDTSEDYVPKLLRLFKSRNRSERTITA